MRPRLLLALLVFGPLLCAEEYHLGPDSQRQPGVPQGKVTKYTWTSKIYPGTTRDYWVYVPAQYDPAKPACVMVVQDGGGWVTDNGSFRAHIVFDNLIHKHEMPVTIGIFINPGILPALHPDSQENRYNRSYEYDALGDRYARFLLEEILPEVGKQYNLSANPDDRGIAGSSSGGIAAFTAAWERPDAFHRVLSFVGSYTNLRGGDIYPNLIRKMEPKPLRVFLQDGQNDLNIYSGSWYLANQSMSWALKYAGYETTFTVGTEGHNAKHGSAILPDALRWLWKDYPKPVQKGRGSQVERHFITEILDPASDWEMVGQGYRFTEGPAVNRAGEVFFTDIPNSRIHKIGADGKITVFKEDTGGTNGLMFGPDGRLYGAQNGRKRVVAWAPDGTESIIAEGLDSNDLAVTTQGTVYVSDPPNKRVWLLDGKGGKRVVYEAKGRDGIQFPNGVRISPDGSLLLVADYSNKWVWSFQIQPDGSLADGEAFYHLETLDDSSMAGPDGMTVDSEGYLYAATRMGVQICDQPGRVVGIIGKPHPGSLSNAVFAGLNLDMLYVTAGDRVYRRHLRRHGVYPWQPVKPPKPHL